MQQGEPAGVTAGAVVEAAPQRRPELPVPWPGWARSLRLLLIVAWALHVAVGLVTGERESSLRDLEAAVAAGEVHEVHLTEGLGPRGRGFAHVQAHWQRGFVGYVTDVIEARPRRQAPPRDERGDATAVIGQDLSARLKALQPGLRIVRVPEVDSSVTFLGLRIEGWTAWPLLALELATLVSLVGSPKPWRATRWAWFWLMTGVPPLGVTAYLLLGGPTPFVPAPRHPDQPLTGGKAFLLAFALSVVLSVVTGAVAT